MVDDLDALESGYPNLAHFARAASELATDILNNLAMIPNYGERRRYDEPILTAFVESTVNVLVDKRFAKKQPMQWSSSGRSLGPITWCRSAPELSTVPSAMRSQDGMVPSHRYQRYPSAGHSQHSLNAPGFCTLSLEQACRATTGPYVHRPARGGAWVLITDTRHKNLSAN